MRRSLTPDVRQSESRLIEGTLQNCTPGRLHTVHDLLDIGRGNVAVDVNGTRRPRQIRSQRGQLLGRVTTNREVNVDEYNRG